MEQSMEMVTPQALCDLYSMLSHQDQLDFLKRLGRISTAEDAFNLICEFSQTERFRMSQILFNHTMSSFFPTLLQRARRLAREAPDISDDDFDKRLGEEVKQTLEGIGRDIAELERAELKEKRDRKSDPETIHRNVKICDLRKQDRKKWSLSRLAKNFDMTTRAITKILSEEAKWRRLGAKQEPTC